MKQSIYKTLEKFKDDVVPVTNLMVCIFCRLKEGHKRNCKIMKHEVKNVMSELGKRSAKKRK